MKNGNFAKFRRILKKTRFFCKKISFCRHATRCAGIFFNSRHSLRAPEIAACSQSLLTASKLRVDKDPSVAKRLTNGAELYSFFNFNYLEYKNKLITLSGVHLSFVF